MGITIDEGSKLEFAKLYSQVLKNKKNSDHEKLLKDSADCFLKLTEGLKESLMKEIKLTLVELAMEDDD